MEGSTFGGHSSHLEKCAHPCRGQTYGKNSENAPPAPKMLWLAHGSYIQGGVPEIRLKGVSRFFFPSKRLSPPSSRAYSPPGSSSLPQHNEGLQQKMCHNALKTERRKKYEINFAREARVFTFQTYTFFKGTCISSKPYTVGA